MEFKDDDEACQISAQHKHSLIYNIKTKSKHKKRRKNNAASFGPRYLAPHFKKGFHHENKRLREFVFTSRLLLMWGIYSSKKNVNETVIRCKHTQKATKHKMTIKNMQ